MKKIINFAIKHPLSIISYSLIFLLIGIISTFTIPIDFLPVLSQRTILITTQFPSLPAKEITELITIPIEDAFSSLNGIKTISSTSRDSISLVKVQLHYGTNINRALIESNQIIDEIIHLLPQDCDKPKAQILSNESNKLLSLYIIPHKDSLANASIFTKTELLHSLDTIDGIGKIQISGIRNDQIQIKLDIPLMNKYNITCEDVYNSLTESNYEYPAGTIKDDENEYTIKTSGKFESISDIKECFIYNSENNAIKLKLFAFVEYQEEELESITLFNNEPCIKLDIYSRPEINPVKTANEIKKKIQKYNTSFNTYNFIILNDRSTEIKKSITFIFISAIISIFVTLITIYYIYRNIRISCILSIPIPASILFSIITLKITGRSLNLISLSGISISIGMVVDAATVICDNIILKSHKSILSSDTISKSILEVKKSTINSALTTILVFIPFFLIPGIFGELFSDFSISVISSILCSLLSAFTLIPSLLKLNQHYLSSHPINFILRIKKTYSNYLKSKYNKTSLSILLITFSVVLSFISFFAVKKEFSPQVHSTNLIFHFTFPQNKNINYMTIETEKIIQDIIEKYNDITIVSNIGISTTNFQLLANPEISNHNLTIEIYAKNKVQVDNITTYLNNKLPGIKQNVIPDYLSQVLNNENITIIFPDMNEDTFLEKHPEALPNEKVNILDFNYDIYKCSMYHLVPSQVITSLYRQLNGFNCGTLNTNGTSVPIIAKSKEFENIDPNNISFLLKEHSIPLSTIGTFSIESKDRTIFRYNRRNAKILTNFNANKKINAIDLSKESLNELLKVSISLLILVFIILYLTLGAQFESYKLPFLLLTSIIPGLSGSLLFLLITNSSININSLLSLIIVSGISINNSIILIESKNYSFKISSIFITSLTSFLALVPFIFFAKINPTQAQISITLIGGIIFSFFSSLLTIPNLNTIKGEKRDK